MGVDLVLYIIRIGKLGPGRMRCSKLTYGSYNPYTNSSDIHYSMFATMFVIWTILFSCNYFLLCHQNYKVDLCLGKLVCGELDTNGWPMCHDLDSTSALPPHVHERLSKLSLLLAYDVETNPGPTELDKV